MALTPKRWIAIALLACATIAVWQLPPRGWADRVNGRSMGVFVPDYGYVGRFGWPDITTKLQNATLHLRLLELRDSVFGSRVISEAKPGLQVLVDHEFPDSIRTAITSIMQDAWRAFAPGTRYPVVAVVVEDTARTLGGLPLATAGGVHAEVFPPDSTTPVCRVLARIPVSFSGPSANSNVAFARKVVAQMLTNVSSGRTILGPCAMYATFGNPGRGIASWLGATEWRAGRTIAWGRGSPVWNDDYFDRYRMPRPVVDFTGRTSLAWQMRYELSNEGIACVSGAEAQCVSGLVHPAVTISGDQEWRTRVIDVRPFAYVWRYDGVGSLGPSSGWILSDMVHDLGRDRFQRLWSSPDTLPVAFEAAAGMPLGPWLARWAQRAYGPDVLGPSIPERARVAGILVLVAGLAVAMVFATERRVA